MIPVVTPEEMAGVDRLAPEPVHVLIDRAGAALAAAALGMLGGSYGRRVTVVVGRGNNGNDGRAAARRLRARGVLVKVVEASALGPGAPVPPCDLAIDAAYGNGLSRPYSPPAYGSTPVLAVDMPSGLSGLTGEIVGAGGYERVRGVSGPGAVQASATVTFAALKPGLLLGDGPARAGTVEVADIGLGGLSNEVARAHVVTDDDVDLVPGRGRNAHKWQSALAVVAGSPGMTGAPWMLSRGALRAGAGYVRLGLPGVDPGAAGLPPGETVLSPLPEKDWDHDALGWVERCRALVVGPGLGGAETGSGTSGPVARLLVGASCPAVVDADGLNALGSLDAVAEVVASRRAPTVLTPHEGEFERLTGAAPGVDRVASVRAAAAKSGAVVLLKGSTTIVAEPGGRVLFAVAGSARLATAGTGDVLSGVIGALLARGMSVLEAAALGAHVHGRAAELGRAEGLVASDLPDLVSRWLSERISSSRDAP
ncbi:MAG TPA: NAD(P)H-hydrate dehydratase [Acidimicrobiales bacterium]